MFKALTTSIFLALMPAAASSQTVEQQVIAQLRDQGFSQISINRTFLGRVRIIATSQTLRREIVFVPETGVILRDYWTDLEQGGAQPRVRTPIVDPDYDDDDDRDDERDDDDDRDDERDDDDDRDDDDERDDDDDDERDDDDDDRDDDDDDDD